MIHSRLSLFSPTCLYLLQTPSRKTNLLLLSTSVSSPPHFLPSYLQAKCGFAPEKAAEASKLLHHVKSPDQPDSVIAFLKSHGFEDPHLKNLFQRNPLWLAQDVEKSFAPKIRALQELGISGTNLGDLLRSYPNVLSSNIKRNFVPKFDLWRGLFGSDKLLMKSLKHNRWIFEHNIEKLLKNLSFLQECGLSDRQISLIVTKRSFIIGQKPESLNELVSRVERLGLSRGSTNFHWGLYVLSMVSDENLQAKLELFRGFGWSEDDFVNAFCNSPTFFTSSVKRLEETMDFFVNVASCPASFIALNPVLFTYSLDKRIIPRVAILKALKEKGLSCGDHKLTGVLRYAKERFFEKYVAPYEEEIPKLRELLGASS